MKILKIFNQFKFTYFINIYILFFYYCILFYYFLFIYYYQSMLSVTPQQILSSPLNNSTAKYHWSFARSKRFKKFKSNCPHVAYESPDTKSKRATSLGKGTRISFELTTDSPSPQLYHTISQFEINKNKGKGTSFGKNREQCRQQGYIKTGIIKNPGPGSYSLSKYNSIQYTMRPKTSYPREYFISDIQKMMIPGPGTYNDTLEFTNPKGSITSKLRTPNRTTLSLSTQRFKKQKLTPGPCDYNDNNIMKTGEYLLSKNQSVGKRLFSHDKRVLKLIGNIQTPGPGSYRLPSEFGYYQKKYDRIGIRH